jgi:hypothetical protein
VPICPDEAKEFARDRDDRLLGTLPAAHQAPVSTVEAILSVPGDRFDALGLPALALPQRPPHGGAVAVVPGRLDEDVADVRVAGLGDVTPKLASPGGVFGGNHAGVRHEFAGRAEAGDIIQFSDQSRGGDQADAAEALQGGDEPGVGRRRGRVRDLRIETVNPLLQLIDSQAVLAEDDLLSRVWEGDSLEPGLMPPAPGGHALRGEDAEAEQELGEAVPRTQQVEPHVFTRPGEIAQGLMGFIGTQTGVSSRLRSRRASLVASRRSVFTRSPGLRGTSEGATTRQCTPRWVKWR